jgi:hypothetical protein
MEPLFWSKAGEVACSLHAPDLMSDRWRLEGWCPIPNVQVSRLTYQCSHCASDGRPHRRARIAEAISSSKRGETCLET